MNSLRRLVQHLRGSIGRIFLPILVWMMALPHLWAAEPSCELLLELRGGERRTVDFWGMENDTLSVSGRTATGEKIELKLPKQAVQQARFSSGEPLDLHRSSGSCPARLAAAPRPPESTTPPPPPRSGTLLISSSEEGLPVWIDDEESSYRTPATIPLDTAEHIIELRWSVEHNLWAAQRLVKLSPGTTLPLHLPLKRVAPSLSVRSSPTNAELWLEAHPNMALPSRRRTPFQLHNIPPGRYNIYLHAEGYRDTLTSRHLSIDHPTHLYIQMEPLTPTEQATQQLQRNARNRTIAGRALVWSALPILVTSTLHFAAADHNYDEAQALRSKIEGVVIANGPHHRRMIDHNRQLVEKGDRKRAVAWGLLASGTALLATGAVLQIDF